MEGREENIRASCYLANNFRGVSDMHHGRGDLQPREVLSFHCHLKVLLILFLSTAKIEEWEIHEASGIRVQYTMDTLVLQSATFLVHILFTYSAFSQQCVVHTVKLSKQLLNYKHMTQINAYHKSTGPGWNVWCSNYLPALQYLYQHSVWIPLSISQSFTLDYKEYLSNIRCHLFCIKCNKLGQQNLPDSADVEPP